MLPALVGDSVAPFIPRTGLLYWSGYPKVTDQRDWIFSRQLKIRLLAQKPGRGLIVTILGQEIGQLTLRRWSSLGGAVSCMGWRNGAGKCCRRTRLTELLR